MIDTTHPDAPGAAAFEVADEYFAAVVEKLAVLCAGRPDADEIAHAMFREVAAQLTDTLGRDAATEVAAAVTARVAERIETMQPTGGGTA